MASDISVTTWTGIASCVLSCGCLLGAAVQGDQAKQLGSARVIQLSAVRGKAWTDHPVQCETDPRQKAVFAEIKETEHTTRKDRTGEWQRHTTPVRHSVKCPEWYVKDGSHTLQVRDTTKADSVDLAEIGHIWTDASGSTVGKAIDVLTGLQVLGRDKVEKAIPIGTGVTVIGELMNTHHAKQSGSADMALQKPRNGGPLVISSKPFKDIVVDYKESSDAFRAGSVFFGGVGVALLGFKVVMFGWRKWTEKRIRDRRVAARLANADNGNGQVEAGEPDAAGAGDHTCVICLDHACDTVFQACGHMCTCSQCSRRLNRCPICRTKTKAIRVYRT